MNEGRRLSLVAVLAGIGIGVAAIGVPSALGGPAGKAALTAPANLGGFQRLSVVSARFGKTGKANAARQTAWDAKSTALLSAAYGGAPAVVTKYSDSGLETFATLFAVRAPSPRPFYEYQDLAYLQLVRPVYEVKQFGDVYCAIQNDPTPAGHTPATDSVHVVTCQRSDSKLTVFVHVSGGTLQNDPARAAGLVDNAWQSLTG